MISFKNMEEDTVLRVLGYFILPEFKQLKQNIMQNNFILLNLIEFLNANII